MEVLGLVASILSIIKATQTVAKGLQKIRSLKNSPAILLAINNENSDICLLAQEVNDAVAHYNDYSGTSLSSTPGLASLERALAKVERLLNELQVLLERLTGSDGKTSPIRWMRAEKSICTMQQELRAAKLDLTAALGVVTS